MQLCGRESPQSNKDPEQSKKKKIKKLNEKPLLLKSKKKKKKKTRGCVPLNATLLGFGSSKSSNLSDFVSLSIKWGHLIISCRVTEKIVRDEKGNSHEHSVSQPGRKILT